MQYIVDDYIVEHIEETDKYYISFKDSVNRECKIEINKKIYDIYIDSKKSYTRIKNQNSRYIEQSEQTEISLYKRALNKQSGLEDILIKNIELEMLEEAKSTLTDIQRRRIKLHIENKRTLKEISEIEGVGKNKIDKSISQGMKKLKKFLKEGGQNS